MADAQTANETTAAGRRTSPPFRADHVGSLLRPPRAVEGTGGVRVPDGCQRRATARGRGRRDPLRREDAARRRTAVGDRRGVPPRVVAHGLHLPARRDRERLPGDIKVQFHNEQGDIEFTPAAIHVGENGAPVTRRSSGGPQRSCSACVEDGVTPKLTIPSPSMVHYRGGRAAIDPSVYPDVDAVLERSDRPRTPTRSRRSYDDGRPLPPVRRHEPGVPQRPATSAR